MTTLSPRLLDLHAAVCAERDDDTVRLAYADCLDEEAMERHEAVPCERAEFVRVQVELATRERVLTGLFNEETDWDACTGLSARWCPNCGDCKCRDPEKSLSDPDCPIHSPDSRHCRQADAEERIEDLRRRERELLEAAHSSGLCYNHTAWAASAASLVKPFNPKPYTFRRGFVEELRLPWKDWAANHESLYWRPGQTVPCPDCEGRKGWMNPTGGYLEFSGTYPKWEDCHACSGNGTVHRPCPPTACPLRKVVLTTMPGGRPNREEVIRLCEKEWPGLDFNLFLAFSDVVTRQPYTYESGNDLVRQSAERMAMAQANVEENAARQIMTYYGVTEKDIRSGRVAMSRVENQDGTRPLVVQCDCSLSDVFASIKDVPDNPVPSFHLVRLRNRVWSQPVEFDGRPMTRRFHVGDGRCPECGTIYFYATWTSV